LPQAASLDQVIAAEVEPHIRVDYYTFLLVEWIMADPASSLCSFTTSKEFDVVAFGDALSKWLEPVHWNCSPPFLVDWYNSTRQATAGGSSLIDADESAVAFALYSVPHYLDTVVDHFGRHNPQEEFVDRATNEILVNLRQQLQSDLDALVVNTDEGPPYYHVQTAGAVAGVDQHIEITDIIGEESWKNDLSDMLEDTRDQKMWGTDPETLRKAFAVNVHPKWGGWYAYRALVVLRGAKVPTLTQKAPLKFLEQEDMKRIIYEYNVRHSECRWRDLPHHPPDARYTPEEYFFFTETSPAKRKRYLEMRVACAAP